MLRHLQSRGLALGLLLLVGCTGRGYTGQGEQQFDTGKKDTGDLFGWRIEGTAVDLGTDEPAAEGLCVHAVDPSGVLLGQPPLILASATVEAEGAFVIYGIETDSSMGVLMVVEDCPEDEDDEEGERALLSLEPTVLASATGVAADDYSDLGDGDKLPGHRTAWSVSVAHGEALAADLAAAGDSKGLDDGALMGFVHDASGNPISGATLTCSGCTPFYAAASGGFTTGAGASTDAAAEAFYAAPGANIGTYGVEAPSHTFQARMAGSMAGYLVFVTFIANP